MASVLHEKLVEALRELDRTRHTLPLYNEALVDGVRAELQGFVPLEETSDAAVFANALSRRLAKLLTAYLFARPA